jgi:hypothetical protein
LLYPWNIGHVATDANHRLTQFTTSTHATRNYPTTSTLAHESVDMRLANTPISMLSGKSLKHNVRSKYQ